MNWQPDNLSEDHVSNFLARILGKLDRWNTAYYNPPSGSWKSVSLIRDDYEYRQVGPKRGVGRIKRPDLALQILNGADNSTVLFLIEAKPRRGEWTPKLIMLLRNYFEQTGTSKSSKPVRLLPLIHRRRIGSKEWEELGEADVDREWFKKCNVTYIFGFAYAIGLVDPKTDLSSEENWMKKTIAKLEDEIPPLVLMAVGWHRDTYLPFVISRYSQTFPEGIRRELDSVFSKYSHQAAVKSTTLDQFV